MNQGLSDVENVDLDFADGIPILSVHLRCRYAVIHLGLQTSTPSLVA